MDDLPREIARIEKRTRRYWFDDGLAEIGTGAGFLLVALYFVLSRVLDHRIPGIVLNVVFPLLVVAVALAGRRAIGIAKDRYVHPRTGYVSFERPHAQRWVSAVLGAVIAALLAFLASRADMLHEWIPATIGLILAVGFLMLGRKAGMLRFPVAGLSCAVLGIVLSILHVSEDLAGAAMFGWLGLIFIVGGTLAFIAYMRQAPPPTRFDRSVSGPGEGA